MTLSKTETIFDWLANILGIAGGIPAITEKLGKIWGVIPESMQKQLQQKMPGFLGLSLEDERIFNARLSKMDIAKQKILIDFLHNNCKDFQRNRFINIVAGMEVIADSPKIIERKWNENTKKFDDETIIGEKGEDLRQTFLNKFAEYIEKEGADEAYCFCISSRMILENPFHQKATDTLREGIKSTTETLNTTIDTVRGEPYEGLAKEAKKTLWPFGKKKGALDE